MPLCPLIGRTLAGSTEGGLVETLCHFSLKAGACLYFHKWILSLILARWPRHIDENRPNLA